MQNLTTNIEKTKTWRVKPTVKWTVVVLSILALSLVFESWRQIKAAVTVQHSILLISAIIITTFLLWVQAFWIYVEEKSKGTLKKKISHFDRLHEYLAKRNCRGEISAAVRHLSDAERACRWNQNIYPPASDRVCPIGEQRD